MKRLGVNIDHVATLRNARGEWDDEVRLPLVKVTEETKIIVKKAIETAKLI